ncbi:hypothetical protein [Streptomyces carpinensis]|uniref:Lipoprotein n=1 Tax=Streptomyces carpinensis TaxID=66369 RepID=A0ABV1W1Y9_9ACTN|nr:hypothetical protein [Streptomyces carpinensis]
MFRTRKRIAKVAAITVTAAGTLLGVGAAAQAAPATTHAILLRMLGFSADDNGGNGIADKSPKEIRHQAYQAMLSAKSVRMTLKDTGSDAQKGNGDSSADLSYDQAGCTGSIAMGTQGSFQLVRRGAEVWVKPDATFWKTTVPGSEGTADAGRFKNRYIHGTTSDTIFKKLADVCTIKALQKPIGSGAPFTDVKKGTETTFNGMKAIPLTGKVDGRAATYYVATQGKPYLIGGTQKGNGTDLTFTLSDYDKPIPSATPSANESVEVSQLPGAS